MDWMVFFISFAVFYSAGARGVGMQECGLLGILFQAAYMMSSYVSGHVVSHRNARTVLFSSTAVCGISSICCLLFTAIGPLSASLVVFGVSAAFFFNSFQAFMRGEASVGSLKNSVALYTLSWCAGAAMGNVTAGWLYNWGLAPMISVVAAAALFIVFMLSRQGKQGDDRSSADEETEHGTCPAHPVENSYIYVGWIMIFTVTFVQRPLFTFLPPMFASEGIGSLKASLPLFVHMGAVALFGFWMLRFRNLLYRKTPFCIIQLCGAASLCVIWTWPSYWVCFFMLFLLGIYGAFVFYCAVYYASNSGRRSFNIGINEALVGLGSIAGLFFGDWWMRSSGSNASMYLVCAAGLAVSVTAQIAAAVFKQKKST